MERKKKILAQLSNNPWNPANYAGQAAADRMLQPLDNVANSVNNTLDRTVDPNTGDAKVDAATDPLSALSDAMKGGYGAAAAHGVGHADLDQLIANWKTHGFNSNLEAYNFANTIIGIADQTMSQVEDVSPIALSLLIRTRNPQSAITLTQELAKFGHTLGSGFWDIVREFAMGHPNDANYRYLTVALLGSGTKPEELSELSRILYTLSDYNAPLSQLVDKYQETRQLTKQQLDSFDIIFQKELTKLNTESKAELQAHLQKLNALLPNVLKENEYWFRKLINIGNMSIIYKRYWEGIHGKTIPLPQQHTPATKPLGAATKAARFVLAQTPPPAPATPATLLPTPYIQNQLNVAPAMEQQNQGVYSTDQYQAVQDARTGNQSQQEAIQALTKARTWKQVYETQLENLQKLTNAGSSSAEMPGQEASGAYLTPEAIQTAANQLSATAYNGYVIAQKAYELFLQMGNDPNVSALIKGKDAQGVAAEVEEAHALAVYFQSARVQALDIALVFPLKQQIKTITPYYDYYKQQIEFVGQAMQGVGSSRFVYPFIQVCYQISGLNQQIAQRYMALASRGESPQLQQFASQQAKVAMMSAMKFKNEATMAMAKMSGMAFGDGVRNPALQAIHASDHNHWTRFGEDLEKRAEEELEKLEPEEVVEATTTDEEWHMIYQGTDADGYSPRHDQRPRRRKKIKLNI